MSTTHASIVGLSLAMCACVSQPVAPTSYDEIYNSYVQGHMEMLRTHAPWMTEAETQAHAQAQAAEVIKSLKAQKQLGEVVPPIMIPLPPPPSTNAASTVETPSLPQQSLAAVVTARQPESAIQPPAPIAERALADQEVTPPIPLPKTVEMQPAPAIALTEPAKSEDQSTLAGTYVIEDGSYSITIEEESGNVVVVEPNKRSIYERQGDGSYQFYNSNTGSTFSLRFLDKRTVEADRVPSEGTPSILKRVDTPAANKALEMNETYAAVARRYSEMAQTDPSNAQAWTMCSAVAFKRSLSDGEDFSRYAMQMSETLKVILEDTGNPCSDAIPNEYW